MRTFPTTRHGIPIGEFRLTDVVPTGIDFKSVPGMIPMYYEVVACNAANYRYFHDWQELTPYQQSILIAHYFNGKLVKSNEQDAENRRQKAEAAKSRVRAKGRK